MAVLSIWSCSNLSNPITPASESLNGIWTEEFIWNSGNIILLEGGQLENNEIIKKSTINFNGNRFEVKVLPPNRILTTKDDSVFVSVSSDTIYTGTFKISRDTLKLFLEHQENPKLFYYQLERDSLHIQQLPIYNSSGYSIIDMGSFIWGNTNLKHVGVFVRNK